MIKINEIFNSFQGEGEQYGSPATFVRLAGCNRKCDFCDTDFSVNSEYSIEELTNKIIEENNKINNSLIIFSGGEPLLQYDKLKFVIRKLISDGYNISMETNGDIIVEPDSITEKIFFTISPKEFWMYDNFIHAIAFKENYPKTSFKFVITTVNELEIILNLMEEFDIKEDKIFLQPEFSKTEELIPKILKNEYGKQLNYKFSFQVHKYLNVR